MPSRSEGFGLVGLEAIEAGTPLLVSNESGLAQLLTEVLPANIAKAMIVSVSDDTETVAENWACALVSTLQDRVKAFAQAGTVREFLTKEKSWDRAVRALLPDILADSERAAEVATSPPSLASSTVTSGTVSRSPREQDVVLLSALLSQVSVSMLGDHNRLVRNGTIDGRIFPVEEHLQHFCRPPLFHMHDTELSRRVVELQNAFTATLSREHWFHHIEGSRVLRFKKAREFEPQKEWRTAKREYMRMVGRSEDALQSFLDYVRRQYPEIDIMALDADAIAMERAELERVRAVMGGLGGDGDA
jgi:hypothetical protein